jgi:hypothetical protein
LYKLARIGFVRSLLASTVQYIRVTRIAGTVNRIVTPADGTAK